MQGSNEGGLTSALINTPTSIHRRLGSLRSPLTRPSTYPSSPLLSESHPTGIRPRVQPALGGDKANQDLVIREIWWKHHRWQYYACVILYRQLMM